MQSTLRWRKPGPALAPWVQCYWRYEAKEAATHALRPDGASGLIFSFGAAFDLSGQRYSLPGLISGPKLTSSELQVAAGTCLLGIRFQPGMGRLFLSRSLAQLQGQQTANSLLLAEQLWPTIQQTVPTRAMESVLLAKVSAQTIPPATRQLLSLINRTAGRQPVAVLAAKVPMGLRQLERQFLQWVGVTPKQYSRIRRAALVRQALRQGHELAAVAQHGGYSDQAHFSRDFQGIHGQTPGQYQQQRIAVMAASPSL
ncbi:helix-turn-helix domain-containing protein [Gallaecimonas sp. GXIMD1310]|uniref:helix-turn-helix domain-containing protein n=1 Tax=Gallaecimonas sp. GXIMD1310 TaxID=3131926 RepID=UPI00324F61FB